MGGRKKQPVKGEGEVGEGLKKKVERVPNYPWTDEREKFYLDLIIQGIVAGLRSRGHFKHQFWNDCIAKFKIETHPIPLLQQLNAKRNTLLARWKCFHRLLNLSGWNFNEATQMITTNELAWEEQYAIDKQVSWFKTHPMKYRDELDQIFGEVTAIGRYAQGETLINSVLLEEAQPEGVTGGDELDVL